MTYLIDTHVFLWSAFSPGKLSRRGREIIESAGNEILVSAITFWELSLKYGLGKLELTGTTPEQLPDVATDMGFGILPLNAAEAASFHRLPCEAHRDPFDRMLAWQAISMRIPLIRKDHSSQAYQDQGLVVVW